MRNSVKGLCEIKEDHVDLTTDLRVLALSCVMVISWVLHESPLWKFCWCWESTEFLRR